MKLSIVIPIFNELGTLREAFDRILNAEIAPSIRESVGVDAIEILVVDDGSTDGSREWLREFSRRIYKLPTRFASVELRLMEQNRNLGKGAAVRRAIAVSTGDIVLIQDADLEYDPKDWKNILAPILQGKADAVIGSRFLGSERRVLFFWHAVLNHCLTLLLNCLCNSLYTDIETCSKAMRGDLARSLYLVSTRFGIEPELCAKLMKSRARIFEVGISYAGRTYAQGKKIKAVDGVAAVWHILRFSLFSKTGLDYSIETKIAQNRISPSSTAYVSSMPVE